MKYLLWLVAVCLLAPVSAPGQQLQASGEGATEPLVQADAAMDIIMEAQMSSQALPSEPKTAKEKLEAFGEEKGWFKTGKWDPKKERLFVIGVAESQAEDPAMDKGFLLKRSVRATEAVLDAKSKIIEYIETNMSGIDKLGIPGTDVNAQLGGEYDRVTLEIQNQRQKVADLLRLVDVKEADKLEGITDKDLAQSAIKAAIKKLDETYSDEKVEEAKRKKLEEVKKSYEDALATLQQLENKAESLQGPLLESSQNMVQSLAKGPLYGAVVINQAESWDQKKGRYQVAVLAVWSPKLEQAARAIVKGEDYLIKPGTEPEAEPNVQEWLKHIDLGSSIGARQFLDSLGRRQFIGIGAEPVGKTAFSEKKARGRAELLAKHAIATSIFSDLYSWKEAVTLLETRGTEDMNSEQVASSFAAMLTQQYGNRSLRGMLELTGKTVVNPISGQEVYVCVYGLSPDSAKSALKMEVRNNATLMEDLVHQTYEKGRKEAMRLAVSGAKGDPTALKKGLRAGTSELSRVLEGDAPTQGTGPIPQPTSGKSQEGVFGGDQDVKDNF